MHAIETIKIVATCCLCLTFAGRARADEPPLLRFQRQVLSDQYYCDGVAAGDINSDGHLDIVAGPFWYEGPEFKKSHAFYEPVVLPREPSPSNSMFSFVAMRLNRTLTYDPKARQFVGDDQANTFVSRERRKGYEIVV